MAYSIDTVAITCGQAKRARGTGGQGWHASVAHGAAQRVRLLPLPVPLAKPGGGSHCSSLPQPRCILCRCCWSCPPPALLPSAPLTSASPICTGVVSFDASAAGMAAMTPPAGAGASAGGGIKHRVWRGAGHAGRRGAGRQLARRRPSNTSSPHRRRQQQAHQQRREWAAG